jgi:DNA-3-methyladenine glycosylase
MLSLKTLSKDFYLNNANWVARNLLGKLLCVSKNGFASGVIVETEAYAGAEDPASHSYKNRRTKRTEIEYAEGGRAYIYFIYGKHYCFNVVANAKDTPDAVLIRALEPKDGLDLMKARRNSREIKNLCSGPGKLCAALGIDKGFYGEDLRGDKIFISDYSNVPENEVNSAPRIGVDYAGEAKDYLYRYYVKNSKFVSKY